MVGDEVRTRDHARTPARRVAVTGVSGFLGQRLLPLLDASPDVSHVVGLDVRDPPRRARKLDFHRIDVLGADLSPYLRDVSVVVHLAAVLGPIPDAELFTRVNVEGTKRLLDAATRAGVRTVVRPSSTAVYGAWANNAVPLREESMLRPSPGYLPALVDAECERLLSAWAASEPGRIETRVRVAPVVGFGARSLFASVATGRALFRVRGADPPIQVVHVDDAAAALELAAEVDLAGPYNVAADGWLERRDAYALVGARYVPALPPQLAERVLSTMWAAGLGDAPPSVLPYLVHPWVVSNERLKAAGWKPRHTNEEAILLASPTGTSSVVPWLVGAGAVTSGALAGSWWLTRRRRRGR